MKIITTNAAPFDDIDSGTTQLGVPWQILDDEGNVLFEATQAFPLTATADEVKAFLSQTLATHSDDLARNAEAEVRQAALDSANGIVGEISNLDISQ